MVSALLWFVLPKPEIEFNPPCNIWETKKDNVGGDKGSIFMNKIFEHAKTAEDKNREKEK